MAKIRAGGVVIDTVQLKEQYRQTAEDTKSRIAELATESLQAQIDAINAASAYRRSQINPLTQSVSKGTKDAPLEGAKVVVKRYASRVSVSVQHANTQGKNVFDILDAGKKASTAGKSFSFPRYTGHTTPESNADVGDPAKVGDIIASGNVAFSRNSMGNVDIAWRKKGQPIKKVPSRDFYKHAGQWVVSKLVEEGITNRFRRSKLRIKKSDIVITFRRGRDAT